MKMKLWNGQDRGSKPLLRPQPQQFSLRLLAQLTSSYLRQILTSILQAKILKAHKITFKEDLQRRCSGILERSHLTPYLQHSVKYSILYLLYRGDSLQCII